MNTTVANRIKETDTKASRPPLPKAVFIHLDDILDTSGEFKAGIMNALSEMKKALKVYLVINGDDDQQEALATMLKKDITDILKTQGEHSHQALPRSIGVNPNAVLNFCDYLERTPDIRNAAQEVVKDTLSNWFARSWTGNTSVFDDRTDQNPTWGESFVTALMVQEKLGGDIVRVIFSTPHLPDEERQFEIEPNKANCYRKSGEHYFNILPDNTVMDLTRDQYPQHTLFISPTSMERTPKGDPGAMLWYEDEKNDFSAKELDRLRENTENFARRQGSANIREYMLPPNEKDPPEFSTTAEEQHYEAYIYPGSAPFRWDKWNTFKSNVSKVEKGSLAIA